jgi:hypothetical protein
LLTGAALLGAATTPAPSAISKIAAIEIMKMRFVRALILSAVYFFQSMGRMLFIDLVWSATHPFVANGALILASTNVEIQFIF